MGGVSETTTLARKSKVSKEKREAKDSGDTAQPSINSQEPLLVPDAGNPVKHPRYWLKLRIGNTEFNALVDLGAARTIIGKHGKEIARRLGAEIKPTIYKNAVMANGSPEPIDGEMTVPLEIAGVNKSVQILVIPGIPTDFILGLDLVRLFGMKIDARRDTFKLPDRKDKKEIAFEVWSVDTCDSPINVASCGLSEITAEEQHQINNLIDELLPRGRHVKTLKSTDLVEHEIQLMHSARPVKQRYHPVSDKMQAAMSNQLDKLIEAGIVEKSHSAWNSPIVMVKKSDGTYRMCVNMQVVNSLSKKDAYPLPYMDVILNKLKRAKYITTIDLSNAYHQIRLTEASKEITAFTIPGRGLWQYTRLPMGLSGSGATFQRLLEELIGDLEPYAYNYLDDIVLATESFEEHLTMLRKLINRINGAGLTINRDKSKFCRKEVKFLGFLVNEKGLMIDPEKTEAVRNYPRPRTLRQLRRFLGMASWYRKFIKDFASIADPLTKLTRKDVKFAWKEEHESAFEVIKKILSEAPFLHRPDPDAEFILHCDASNTGLGSVITQIMNGEEKVIAYASRALRKNELNYSTTERECLAIKFAIEKFRPYVEGSIFTVITDHSALQWLFKKKDPVGRLGRWAQELMSYDFKIVHRKGKYNVVPDALSRMYEDDESVKINSIEIKEVTTDKWYKKRLYQILKFPRRYRDWKVVEGKIYRYKPNRDVDDILTDLDAWKLVVPKEKREQILEESHSEPTSGHPGKDKTYNRLAQFYYWPGAYKDTVRFVRNCKICQQTKTVQQPQVGLMGTRDIDRPWKIIAADLMGDFPKSKAGFQYLIVFEDLFSRFIICVPIRKKTAASVKNALENIVCAQYGTPEIFLSDNGREFINETMKNFLTENSIFHEKTPAYHPQSNPVERVNRDLKTRITAYIQNNHKEWDKFIPQFQFAHNTSVHSTTGMTPAFLVFGRELHPPKLWRREAEARRETKSEKEKSEIHTAKESEDDNPDSSDDESSGSDGSARKHNTRNRAKEKLEKSERKRLNATEKNPKTDEALDSNGTPNNKSDNDTLDRKRSKRKINEWSERMQKLKHIHDNAQILIDKGKSRQESHYNKNKREYTFKIGQLVWKKNKILSSAQKDISAKLAKPYNGPFIINDKIGEDVYTIRDTDGKILSSSCHAKEFKEYTSEDKPEEKPEEKTKNKVDKSGNTAAVEKPKRRPGRPRKLQTEQ